MKAELIEVLSTMQWLWYCFHLLLELPTSVVVVTKDSVNYSTHSNVGKD